MLLRIILLLIPSLCFSENRELIISPKSEEYIKEIIKSTPDETINQDKDSTKNLEKKLINYINKYNSNNIKIITTPNKNKSYILIFFEKDLMIPKNKNK